MPLTLAAAAPVRAALCAAHRIPHSRVPALALAAALEAAPAPGGIRVVEVATDRSGLRALHAEIRAALR